MTSRRIPPVLLVSLLLALASSTTAIAQSEPADASSGDSGWTESSETVSQPQPTQPAAAAEAPAADTPAPAGEESPGVAPACEPCPECEDEGEGESTPRWTIYFGGLIGGASTVAGNNPYGFGFGLQGGVTLGRPSFYFGLTIPWYAGDDKSFQFALDIGYDFRSGPVVLRPLIAVGADRWRLDQPMGVDLKEGAALFGMGIHLHFDLGAHGFVGGEFRWDYTTHGGDDSSWHAWGVFGARFSG